MQFKATAITALLTVAGSVAALDHNDLNTWTTLSPNVTFPGGATEFTSTFGIAVQPIQTSASASLASDVGRNPISQIGDGQIQATQTPTPILSSVPAATPSATGGPKITASACKNEGTLQMTLRDSILRDARGRIGAIVSNRQFQFDGPPPQAGSIYAKGWSLTPDGNLALGDSDVFYQCLSGDFYNLYDQNIAPQCSPIHLQIISLTDCGEGGKKN